MPLVTSVRMLKKARDGGYAVGAFNAENMEMVQAIVAAAEEENAPVIVQTTPSTLKYAPPEVFFANVEAVAKTASVPVALHLDHGDSFALAIRALAAGYTSIMIDGSQLALGENIAITRKVAEACEAAGVPVEGELGKVGGKEDDTESDGCGYTDPDEAERFVKETGIASIAVGVGTAHGFYAAAPVLNIELISILRERVGVPMVLHGASGLSPGTVRECVARGICKVNFATELRDAYSKAVKAFLAANPGAFDPKKYGSPAREAVKTVVRGKISGLKKSLN